MEEAVIRNEVSGNSEKKGGVTGTGLKIIALVAMFIDHFAAIFVTDYIDRVAINNNLYSSNEAMTMYVMSHPSYALINLVMIVMRLIGRFGFPLFAFLLVEGFCHTRSVKKYAMNLGIFALVSELPFNLGFKSVLFYPDYQNVFFTLFLGLVCLAAIKYFAEDKKWSPKLAPLFYLAAAAFGAFSFYAFTETEVGYIILMIAGVDRTSVTFLAIACACTAVVMAVVLSIISLKWDSEKKNRFTFTVIPVIIFAVIADFLKTDYSGWGVLTIVIMYLLRNRRVKSFLFGCIALTVMSIMECTAFFMLIPVAMYNGKRGMKMNKYFFYAFYPVHIGLIYLLTLLCAFTTFTLR